MPRELRNTGMPLGILEEASWEAKSIGLDHGDTLIMYTDGVTEAQNLRDEFFGDQRLLTVTQDNLSASVLSIFSHSNESLLSTTALLCSSQSSAISTEFSNSNKLNKSMIILFKQSFFLAKLYAKTSKFLEIYRLEL